jgi:predicted  nucleic acid-binding Zn-ribbon protein
MNYNERFGQIEAMLADLLRRMDRQAEQIDSIISILKISDERQTRAEERQDAMLAEIREQGQRIDAQGQRIDAQGQRIDAQGQRLDALLTAQMRMLDLMSRQSGKTDELTQQIPSIAAYESRVRRLEEAVFNKAS